MKNIIIRNGIIGFLLAAGGIYLRITAGTEEGNYIAAIGVFCIYQIVADISVYFDSVIKQKNPKEKRTIIYKIANCIFCGVGGYGIIWCGTVFLEGTIINIWVYIGICILGSIWYLKKCSVSEKSYDDFEGNSII